MIIIFVSDEYGEKEKILVTNIFSLSHIFSGLLSQVSLQLEIVNVWKKPVEDIVVTSIFSFSLNVFYSIKDRKCNFSNIEVVLWKCFEFGPKICHLRKSYFNFLPPEPDLTTVRKRAFENIVRKEENAGNQDFQCFLPFLRQISIFQLHSILSFANAFNFEQSKVLSFGKELT